MVRGCRDPRHHRSTYTLKLGYFFNKTMQMNPKRITMDIFHALYNFFIFFQSCLKNFLTVSLKMQYILVFSSGNLTSFVTTLWELFCHEYIQVDWWDCFLPVEWELIKHAGLKLLTSSLFDSNCMRKYWVLYFSYQVEWLKNEELLTSLNDDNIDTRANSLIITQARLSDSGNYSCQASNVVAKRRSAPAAVLVFGKTHWSLHYSMTWHDHKLFMSSCHVYSHPEGSPLVRWKIGVSFSAI